MRYDVIIIGSGLGALECAHILTSEGRSVLMLEREVQPGGCMQSYQRGAFHFDTGLHYVGGLAEGQSLYLPFRMLGLLDLPWRRMDADGFDLVTIGRDTYRLAEGFDRFVDTLAREFPDDRQGLEAYARMLQQSNADQWKGLRPSDDPMDTPLASEAFNTGAWNYLRKTFRSERLINVLSGNSMRLELRKESLPLFTFAHCNGSYVESSWRLMGPGNMLVNKLLDDIRRQGGELICQADVTSLIEKDGRITEVETADGRRFEGDIIISDAHPAVTLGMITDSHKIRPMYRRRICTTPNTFGMLTVQLVIRPGALRYFNHNHYVFRKDNVWNFYEESGPVGGVMVSSRASEPGNIYATQVDLLTPMLWEECSAWQDSRVMRRPAAYRTMKERRADEAVALAERVIPGLKDITVARYVSTPLTYRDYTLSPDGSAFGMRKDYHNPILTTLSPRTPIANLLLTGQSLMMHGVQGVTMTALLTCAEIIGKERMWNKLAP